MYSPIITHDIDRYYKWSRPIALLGEFKRIINNQSSWSINESITSFKNRRTSDPFSNMKQIADLNANAGIKSVFYLMTTTEKHEKNINDYKISEIKDDLNYVMSIGSEIGIHPGILTYNNLEKLREQKNRLEEIVKMPIKRSRQHYLQYENPTTFQFLEKVGIENDSSIYPTQKYDTYAMAEADITQTPLVFMDTHHMHKSDDEILITLEASLEPAKQNGGEVMVLWHNNNISNDRERGLYREALQVIAAI